MDIPEVTSTDWFKVTGHGWVAVILNVPAQIPNDFALEDFLKTGAIIDGKQYKVFGVERQGFSRRNFGLCIGAER